MVHCICNSSNVDTPCNVFLVISYKLLRNTDWNSPSSGSSLLDLQRCETKNLGNHRREYVIACSLSNLDSSKKKRIVVSFAIA